MALTGSDGMQLRHGVVLLVLVSFLSSSCSTSLKRRDWSDYDGPGAEYFHKEEYPFPEPIPDHIEPVNRSLGAVNHGLIIGIIRPLGKAYTFVVPQFIRTGIRNFARNLAYPRNFLTSLLQAKWQGANDETLRFVINTTLGVGGLFDPATSFGVEPSRSDFGLTFGKWGWTPNIHVVLPLYGPTNDRDLVGEIPDTLTEPLTYLAPTVQVLSHSIPISGLFKFNELSGSTDTYRKFTQTQYDPYQLGRLMWTVLRLPGDPVYAEEYVDRDSSAIQTLGSIFFTPQDKRFESRAKTRHVRIPATGRRLPYTFWKQRGPGPLAFVLPGIGGHRLSSSAAALAEIPYTQGFSVVVISSTMNFEFMERASSLAVPGYAPADTREVWAALELIYKDLAGRYPDAFTSNLLMGVSFGGFHTLFLAAEEANHRESALQFDRYVAVNPPVRLFHGMTTIDGFYNTPLRYPDAERDERVYNTFRKLVRLQEKGLEPGMTIPLERLEAEFLIGISFRLILMDVIHSSQSRNNLGVLQTKLSGLRRANAYREISEYSLMEYFYAFVYPWLEEHDDEVDSPEDIVWRSDLASIEDALRKNSKVRIFPNRNDFLYAPEDIAWLERVFGDRVHIFESGGHMGNLPRREVQARIAAAFSDLAAPGPDESVPLDRPKER